MLEEGPTIRSPKSPTGPSEDWKWGVIKNADSAIESDHDTDGEESNSYNANGVFVAQTDGKHRRGKFPGRGIECIAAPVSDQAPDTPFPILFPDWIEILK